MQPRKQLPTNDVINHQRHCDDDAQKLAGCVIGVDYPAPVVDHAQARERTLARFGVLKGEAGGDAAEE